MIGGPATAVGEYLEHTAGLHIDEQQAQIAIPQAQALGNTDHGIEGAIDHPLLDVEIERRDVDPLPGQRHGIAEIVTILFVLQLVIGHTLQMLALTIEAHQLHAIRRQPAYLGIVRIAVHQHGKLGGNVVTLVATRRLEQDGLFRHAAHMAQRHRQLVIETTAGERQEDALIATYTVELALDQCVTQQIPTHQNQYQNGCEQQEISPYDSLHHGQHYPVFGLVRIPYRCQSITVGVLLSIMPTSKD